jgi:hypothetical protein
MTNPQAAAPYVSQNLLPNGIRHLMPMIRVACITLDGTTLTVPAKELADHMAALDDSAGAIEGDEVVYTLTFKTMLVRDYEALGEFNGF